MLLFGLKVREYETVTRMGLYSVFAKLIPMVDDCGRDDLFWACNRLMNEFDQMDGFESNFILSINKDIVYICRPETYFDRKFCDDKSTYGVFFVTLEVGAETAKFTRII